MVKSKSFTVESDIWFTVIWFSSGGVYGWHKTCPLLAPGGWGHINWHQVLATQNPPYTPYTHSVFYLLFDRQFQSKSSGAKISLELWNVANIGCVWQASDKSVWNRKGGDCGIDNNWSEWGRTGSKLKFEKSHMNPRLYSSDSGQNWG